jgi:hypothetical protein
MSCCAQRRKQTLNTQRTLSDEQIAAFYHDEFVEDQARHFVELAGAGAAGSKVVVDVGGGCGFFARRLAATTHWVVRVLDTDNVSVETCQRAGVPAVCGDALRPQIVGDEEIVSFNLILHHLVADSERSTFDLQRAALAAWRSQARAVFVNEYIYESYWHNLSGWLIFQVTRSRILSRIARLVAAVVPSFRANTFGVGVRFRAHGEWRQLFAAAGYDVKATALGEEEKVALPLRALLIRCIRRDSFLLEPCKQ